MSMLRIQKTMPSIRQDLYLSKPCVSNAIEPPMEPNIRAIHIHFICALSNLLLNHHSGLEPVGIPVDPGELKSVVAIIDVSVGIPLGI